MTWSRNIALAVLVTACTYDIRPEQAPSDPSERRRAEASACLRGTFPPWLDDAALGSAIRIDQREAQASTANESFHGARFSSQPPAAGGASARGNAILEERRRFQEWCAAMRPGGSGSARP